MSRTFLLVHGAFRGAWSWDRVAEGLRARGHQVVVPTLTGLGEKAHLLSPNQNLETYIADIVSELRVRSLREVTLVAHSFAGFPVTGAADRECDRIARLVYLDAAVPEDGQSNFDVSVGARAGWLEQASSDGWSVAPMPVEVLQVNDADREMVRNRLTRMPLAPLMQRLRFGRGIRSIPRKEFVLATGWAANPYVGQVDRLSAHAGWKVDTVDTGHEVMLDAPEWVVDYLDDKW